jgi:hypothetical protein
MQCTWSVLYSNRKQKKNTVFSLKYLKIIDIFNPIEIKKIKKRPVTIQYFDFLYAYIHTNGKVYVGWLVYGV